MATNVQPALSVIDPSQSSAAPIPNVTCYSVPYGAVGFFNHLATLYILVCLTNQRSPLWHRHRIRHSTFNAGLWATSVVCVMGLNASNLKGCVGPSASAGSAEVRWALGMIIMGKLILAAVWGATMIWKIGEATDKKNDGGAGTDARGAVSTANADTGFTGVEFIVVELSPLEQAGSKLSGMGLDTENGNDLLVPGSSDILRGLNEPLPSDASIGSGTLRQPAPSAFPPSLDHKRLEESTTRPADLASASPPSFSRDASPQTPSSPSPPPSIPAMPAARNVAQALSTPVDSNPIKSTTPEQVGILTAVALLLLNLIPVLCVVVGTAVLAVVTFGAGDPAGRNSVGVIALIFAYLLIIMAGIIIIPPPTQGPRDRGQSTVERGAYAQLGEAQSGDAGGATEGGGAAALTAATNSHLAEALSTSTIIGDQQPNTASAEQNDTVAVPTAPIGGGASVTKPGSKSVPGWLLIVAFMCITIMWFADWVVGAAAGNLFGIPTANVETWQWVTYLVVTKLPMLSF